MDNYFYKLKYYFPREKEQLFLQIEIFPKQKRNNYFLKTNYILFLQIQIFPRENEKSKFKYFPN